MEQKSMLTELLSKKKHLITEAPPKMSVKVEDFIAELKARKQRILI